MTISISNMNDPWENLEILGRLYGIRQENTNQKLYWCKEENNGNRCLFFRMRDPKTITPPANRLPSIEVIKFQIKQRDYRYLCIELTDQSYKDIFYEFCNLLISSCIEETRESAALDVLIQKSWRWQSLLTKQNAKKLSDESQKGLIGELYFLNEFLFPIFQENESISSWYGPTGSSKDFEFSSFQVEIKSKRSGAKPSIRISSADQLEIIPNTSLFMAVFGIDKNNSEQSKSLTQWIKDTVEKIYNSDFIGCLQDFYDVLDESGYREDQDPYYQDQKWDIKEIKFFEITEAFPRIVASKIPTSLLNVNYSIDMNAVSPFEISKEKLLEFLNAAKS